MKRPGINATRSCYSLAKILILRISVFQVGKLSMLQSGEKDFLLEKRNVSSPEFSRSSG
jgi:hypothetical protein